MKLFRKERADLSAGTKLHITYVAFIPFDNTFSRMFVRFTEGWSILLQSVMVWIASIVYSERLYPGDMSEFWEMLSGKKSVVQVMLNFVPTEPV